MKFLLCLSLDFKQKLINYFDDVFNFLGIDPLLGGTILFLIIILPTVKYLKRWEEVPRFKKHFLISGWIVAVLSILSCLIIILAE